MNFEEQYRERLERIVAADSRYAPPAYDFVRESVAFTTNKLEPPKAQNKHRHITGQQLLDGIRELALQEFGPLAIDVLHEWGVTQTRDFGNIVFNLVEHNLLGASEDDAPTDFDEGYDFDEAFVKPFAQAGGLPPDLPKIA